MVQFLLTLRDIKWQRRIQTGISTLLGTDVEADGKFPFDCGPRSSPQTSTARVTELANMTHLFPCFLDRASRPAVVNGSVPTDSATCAAVLSAG